MSNICDIVKVKLSKWKRKTIVVLGAAQVDSVQVLPDVLGPGLLKCRKN